MAIVDKTTFLAERHHKMILRINCMIGETLRSFRNVSERFRNSNPHWKRLLSHFWVKNCTCTSLNSWILTWQVVVDKVYPLKRTQWQAVISKAVCHFLRVWGFSGLTKAQAECEYVSVARVVGKIPVTPSTGVICLLITHCATHSLSEASLNAWPLTSTFHLDKWW